MGSDHVEVRRAMAGNFVSIHAPAWGATFHPIKAVLDDKEMKESLLLCAVSELKAFERKYSTLSELAGVFEAIKCVERGQTK